MKKTIFEGMATAIITPITENGIDYDAFAKLIDWQIEQGIDAIVVCGTTGWDVNAIKQITTEDKGLMWSSNYSIGVNILFALNKQLAKFMEAYPAYTPHMTEVHHIHNLDAPSGTAKTLQEAIGEERLPLHAIESIREGEVPGIHTVTWDSEVDTITISHSAKSRNGFALGAVIAAEWMKGKTGYHSFEEVILK